MTAYAVHSFEYIELKSAASSKCYDALKDFLKVFNESQKLSEGDKKVDQRERGEYEEGRQMLNKLIARVSHF